MNYINEYISIKTKSEIKVSILNNDTMPKSSFFMYPRNDDDYGFSWGVDLGCNWNWNWNSWYGRSLKGIFNISAFIFATLYSIFGYYLMWILLHYVAAQLYPTYCVPLTISGLLLSPFMSSAPHCVALRWLITEGSNVIVTMWVVFGTYAIRCMLRR